MSRSLSESKTDYARALSADLCAAGQVYSAVIVTDLIDQRDQLVAALIEIRDAVLHQRGPLAESPIDSDDINAVLSIIDDATPDFVSYTEGEGNQ